MHLIETLRHEGVRDEKVLGAMSKVPRHLFLEKAFEEWAYKNVAFPIGCEQTISQPLTVAIQTGLLEVIKGETKMSFSVFSKSFVFNVSFVKRNRKRSLKVPS